MIKKEQVMGREVSLSLSPLQAIQNFFGAQPKEQRIIRRYTSEYREYRKKIVSEGRGVSWGKIKPIKEKVRR